MLHALGDVARAATQRRFVMKPFRSILDPSFCYVPSVATSVASTWRRAGWRPTTDDDRRARRQAAVRLVVGCVPVDPPVAIRRIAKKLANGTP